MCLRSVNIKLNTLYTGPKPPSPNLLSIEKLFVALFIKDRSNKGSSRSWASIFSWSSAIWWPCQCWHLYLVTLTELRRFQSIQADKMKLGWKEQSVYNNLFAHYWIVEWTWWKKLSWKMFWRSCKYVYKWCKTTITNKDLGIEK